METAYHEQIESDIKYDTKNIVVVLDGKNNCITDILRAIVTPKQVSADHIPSVVAIGYVDGSQFREIVKIMDRNRTMPQ